MIIKFRYWKLYFFLLLFIQQKDLKAQSSCSLLNNDTTLFQIEYSNKIINQKIFEVVSKDTLQRLYPFLYFDSLDYQFEVKSEVLKNLSFFNNKLIKVFIHHDSNYVIDKACYLFSINSSSIIKDLNMKLGKTAFFGSFNKRILSNGEEVESIYFWNHPNNGQVLLSFFDKYRVAKIFPDILSDLAVILVYKKK